MTKFITVISLFVALCCTKKASGGDFTSYSVAEFDALLKGNKSIQLVDVRRPDEFKAGHIEGAILIDVTEKDFLAKADSLLDKSRLVAVYCRSGRRSRRAAEMLVEKGYTVHNLNEGYHEWRLYQEGKKP
ncbi:rhodanese-like domain-containing protein [Tannerella forsythia]|uniref:rhodanese-like domain-containing protein n=1 Tax=Tannerella forsythia TaxID=28112 RepID=UPI00086C1E47|nr:rhodanese-like domain-containing protein [Tannerella forsythia]SCQ20745.1 Thiosulfate sulfurtransferase PspE [Tannerella forsythia]